MASDQKSSDTVKMKGHLSIVIVGHVDAGKSTTTGRLLTELGNIDKRELLKLQEIAKENNKESFGYAYIMDKSKTSRTRGVTIDCSTKEFFTSNYHYSVIDAPGHTDFIKNMINGASQADVALLMVPANKGGFEKSIAKGNHKTKEIMGQTRQHARLCHLLGIEQIIVGINKMDEKSVNFSQERFIEIKNEMTKMLSKIGYKTKRIAFIPMSGYKGDNLIKKSSNMDWYNGWEISIKDKKNNDRKKKSKKITGFTLLDALDTAIKIPKREIDKPLRMPVSGLCLVKGHGTIITGRVEQGFIKPQMNVKFYPKNINGKVMSIQMHHKNIEIGKSGDSIGLCIRGLNKLNMPKIGDIMCGDNENNSDKYPPLPVKSFKAMVFVQDHPGKLKYGFTPLIHVRTMKCPCKMIKIDWKCGKSTGNVKIEGDDIQFVESGDQAQVTFEPLKPFVCQPFDICKPLGRLAAMNSNTLIMLGKVVQVELNNT